MRCRSWCRARRAGIEVPREFISVPLQLNWDDNIGVDRDGHKLYLNIQPVIPSKLNTDWTLISRIIVPVIDVFVKSQRSG
jgi:hypothetical protein